MKSVKSFFGTQNSFYFVLFFSRWLKPLHFSASDLMQWQALRGKDTQCPYSVTFPPVGFDWPQHMHSNPCSTTNKSLSPDTIQQKVCSRSSPRTLSAFGPYLFWFSPFQQVDVWHGKIDMPVAQNRDWNCDVVRRNNGLNRWESHLNLGVILFIHKLLSLTSG